MNATSVASSGQMVSPFHSKTHSPSLGLGSFAPRSHNQNGGASFGLDDAGDSRWAKTNKRKGRFNDQSDGDGKLQKVKNPFKTQTHDANLSDGSQQGSKKRGGERVLTMGSGTGQVRQPKTLRDETRKPRQHNGNGGLTGDRHHVTSTEEDDESRPTSSSSASSVDEGGEAVSKNTADPFAMKVYDRLRRDGISPPPWPSQPGHPKNKAEMAKFREKYEEYRKKVRASLTKACLIDDPEKRKTLQDAIDFRGICQDMCPEYEKITRITELDVAQPEKSPATSLAKTSRMVKKLARSAAGQEAPLPMDVRSTATLRRTLDYLVDHLLQNDDNLPALHGFLWDRTRAIRRDFTFFSSPTVEDLTTQAYVLENIVRFHVTSLHLLSQEGKAGEDFVEQQELEQLGKALLSLRDLYDDCNAQGIQCVNEAEFRAYYLIFHAHDPSILETLQRQWKPHLWRDSDEIRTAAALVEALQNTVDFHGPLKHAPSLAASSALLSYFRIVESGSVSYIMACFAECHFPHLRRSILRVIRRAMARPKDTTNDVTAETLNRFLRFDTIQQAVDFAKLHDIDVLADPQAPEDPGRQMLVLNNKGPLPGPRLSHQFSRNIVERKRGMQPLPDVIHGAVPARRVVNGLPAEEEAAIPQGVERFDFGNNSASNGAIKTPSSAETKASASSPFASITQKPMLAGTSQASAGSLGGFKSQAPSTQANPFATAMSMKPTPFGSAATANPFASATPADAAQQSPFGSKASSASLLPSADAAVVNPFAASTAPATTAPSVFGTVQPPSQPFNNPFASISQPSFAGAAAVPKEAPAALSGHATATAAPPVSSVFAPVLGSSAQPTDGSRRSTPFSFQGNGTISSSTTTTTAATTDQANAGISTPSAIPSLPPSKPPAFEPPTTAQPAMPKPTVGSTPFSFPGVQPSSAPPPQVPEAALSSSSAPSAPKRKSILPEPGTPTSLPPPQPRVSRSPSPSQGRAAPSTTPPTSPTRPAKLSSTVARRPRDLLGDFTKWFVLGDGGLLQDFEVFMVESIVSTVYDSFRQQEEERIAREKEERDNAEADKFRTYNLSVKYFYGWKQKARERRLRQLRKTGREQFRAFREAQRAARIKEEQEAAQRMAQQHEELAALNRPRELASVLRRTARQRQMAEEALLESGVLSGISNEREAAARIVQRGTAGSLCGEYEGRRSRSGSVTSSMATASVLGGSKTRALREELLGAKPGRFRRSLPSQSPDLDGSVADHNHHRTAPASRVSERWRLKAMGIVQMPDGTALPDTMAREIRQGMMRDLRGPADADVERKRKRISGDYTASSEHVNNNDNNGIDQASKTRGEGYAENLIRELRAMRQEMEAGTQWFKQHNDKLHSEILSRGGTPLGS